MRSLFLDADDWLAPDALARLAVALEAAPGAVAATARFRAVPETAMPGSGFSSPSVLPGSGLRRRPFCPDPGFDPLPLLLERNLFANGGHLLIRRTAVDRAGGFRAGIAYGEDWEYWIRLALLGRFAAAPGNAPVLFVRQRASGAYLRMATDENSFRLCMDAIFDNPALVARFGRRTSPRSAAVPRRRTAGSSAASWSATAGPVRVAPGCAARHGKNPASSAPSCSPPRTPSPSCHAACAARSAPTRRRADPAISPPARH